MKTIFNKIGSGLWLLAVSIFALLSVSGCIEEDMPFIVLDNDVVTVDTGTSKTSVDVKANVKWGATSDQAWCKIYSTEGNYKGKFDFVVDPNPTTEERTAIITVAALDGSVQATLMVKQAPIGAKLFISEDKVSFNRNKGSRNIAVVSNHSWKVISSSDWCTVSPESGDKNGNIEIKVPANDTGKERTACVTVICEVDGDPFIKTVDVVQAATDFFFVVPVTEYNLSNAAKTLEIGYDVEGDDIDIRYETNVDWITFGDFVESAEKVVANVAANTTGEARSAKVVLTASNNGGEPIVRIVEINQTATDFFFVVPVKEFEVTNAGKTIEIPYETEGDNVEVTCETNADWISFKELVPGSGKVEAVVAPNTTGKPRTGKIVLSASNNGQEPILQTVTVSQSAKDFYFVVPVQKFELTNAKETVAIKYDVAGDDVKIKHETNVKWISFKEMVEGAGQVEIVVDQNKTGADRSAKVVLTASNNAGEPIVHTVEILQSGKDFYFTVPVKEFDVTNAGGVVAVDYKAEGDDVKIEYRSNAEWLSFKDFVEGADQIEVVVAENATGKEREGQVVISASNNGGEPIEYTVNIKQSAKDFYFVVPVKKYELSNAEKALAFKYEVEGDDVKIKYEANVEWISFKNFVEGAGQIEAVVAANATGEERSAEVVITASNNGGEPIVEKIQVFQGAKDFFFAVPVKKYELSNAEKALAFKYEVEGDDVKIKYEANVDWITFEDFVEGAGQIEAVVAANKTGKPRSAKVVITASNNGGEPIVETVEVFQGAKDFFFVIPVTEYNIGFSAKRFPINYKVNGDSVKVEYEANVDWIEFGDFVADSCCVNVEVFKNKTGKERTGKVIVTASNNGGEPIVRTVTITQAASGFFFVIPVEEYNLNNEQHEIDIEFDIDGENLNIIPTTDVDWIEIGELSYRNSTLHITVAANKTGKPRTGKVVIRATSNSGEPIIRTVVIKQSAKNFYFAVPIKKYNVSEASNAIIPIIYNTDGDKVKVNAQPNVSWIQVVHEDTQKVPDKVPGLLAGDGVVYVRVYPNLSGEERTGTVTLTATNNNGEPVVEVVEIVQGKQDAYLEMTKDKFFFGADGGRDRLNGIIQLGEIDFSQDLNKALPAVIAVYADADWIVFPNGENYTEDMSSGQSVLPLHTPFLVKENTTGKDRVAEIQITCYLAGQEAIVRKVVVEQSSNEFFFVVPLKEYTVSNQLTVLKVKYNVAGDNVSIDHVTDADWIRFEHEPALNQIKVRVDNNWTGKVRTAEIALTASSNMGKPVVETIRITQSAEEWYFVLGNDYFQVPSRDDADHDHRDLAFRILYHRSENVTRITPVSNADWIQVSGVAPQDIEHNCIRVDCKPNLTNAQREGEIAITVDVSGYAPKVYKVRVLQSATERVLDILSDEVEFEGNKGLKAIVEYVTNCKVDGGFSAGTGAADISFLDYCPWLGYDNKIDLNHVELETQSDNITGKDRVTYFTLKTKGFLDFEQDGSWAETDIVRKVKVTQHSLDTKFEFGNENYVFGFNGGKNYVTLLSTGDWKVDNTVPLPNWIVINPDHGTGNANITIDLKENVFAQKRTAQILFVNTTLDKTAILNIEQEGNPSGIVNFSHLGKGFDVSGMYAYDEYVKASVLDCAQLYEGGHVADIINAMSFAQSTIEGKTRKEYESNYAASAGVGGSVAGFTASVETNFSTGALSSEEHSFGTYRSMAKKQIIKLYDEKTAADVMDCRSAMFIEDIKNMSAANLVTKYGTHVIMGLSLGGVLDYSMSADMTCVSDNVSFGIALEAGFEMAGYGASAGTSYDQYKSVTEESSGFESKLVCRGGESQFASTGVGNTQNTYDQWLASLNDPHKWVMTDYEGPKLIPLWEFIEPGAKRDEVEKVAKAQLTGTPIQQHSTNKFLNVKVVSMWSDAKESGKHTEWQFEILTELDGKPQTEKQLWLANGTADHPTISIPKKKTYDVNNVSLPRKYYISERQNHTLKITVRNPQEIDDGGNDNFNSTDYTIKYTTGADTWENPHGVVPANKRFEIVCLQEGKHDNPETLKFVIELEWNETK